MITFFACISLLIASYFIYSRYLARVFKVNTDAPIPAITKYDSVDYLPLPAWRLFLIQFLNIAGLGPIFGAILGAMFGPVAFLWITFGAIFIGTVHDFASGMLSLHNQGEGYPEMIGRFLGSKMKFIVRIMSLVLMVMVGAVFLAGPAGLLTDATGLDYNWWVLIIIVYYILATLMPIDKIIGPLYPVFGAAILLMTISLLVVIFASGYQMVELTSETFRNMHLNSESTPIFPMMFITIACGAISGFHATQSPIVARCLKNQRYARPVFFGAMITEAIIAMIWAAIAMAFFGGVEGLNSALDANSNSAPWAINQMADTMLGKYGFLLIILGVVIAPITTGDTAFRSARLIAADFTGLGQKKIKNRLIISLPLFAIGFGLTLFDFDVIWRYFAWINQLLAAIMLWAVTGYLIRAKVNYWITLIPAIFMTAVTTNYILISRELGFGMSTTPGLIITAIVTIAVMLIFFNYTKKQTLCPQTK